MLLTIECLSPYQIMPLEEDEDVNKRNEMRWCSRYWPGCAWSHFHLIAAPCSQPSQLSALSSLKSLSQLSWLQLPGLGLAWAPSHRVTGCILPTTHLLQWADFFCNTALSSFELTLVLCVNLRVQSTPRRLASCSMYAKVSSLSVIYSLAI